MLIGKKVRELRRSKKMSLSELANKSGIQIATLSRIEHQKMTGTLDSHIKISQALGIDVTALYDNILKERSNIEVTTDNTATDVFVHSNRSSYEILTKNILTKKMMPILLSIESDGKTNKEQGNFGSEKFIFVLEGNIVAIINNKEYPLSRSNTLYFDSSQEHYFKNTGKATAKVIVVGTPVEL